MAIGMLAFSAPAGAIAFQDDGTSPPTDPSYSDPAYDDTVYTNDTDDVIYTDDLCDPAFHPDPASDPYCNPAATYDESYSGTVPGPATDHAAYCDPAGYPDWAADPYCNPEAFGVDAPPSPSTTTVSADRLYASLTSRSPDADATPLTELDPAEAPLVGAGRMLLAIDAIAELGGFERAITPGGAVLLRDIREGIPAEGLDEFGYTLELEQFVTDFIPFLESLEARGVIVSKNLWDAAEGLETIVFGDFNPATADESELGLLEPRPWIQGLGDLLIRGGTVPQPPTPDVDEHAIRELLAAFAAADVTPTATTSTLLEDTPPPTALPLLVDSEPVGSDTSGSSALLVTVVLVVLAVGGALALLLRRRSKTRPPTRTRGHDQVDSKRSAVSASPEGLSESARPQASVTELLDASRRMSASLDAGTIASIALSEAKRIVGAEGGIVVRRTDEGLEPVGCEPPLLFNYDGIVNSCLPRVIETGQATAAIAHDDPLLIEVPMAMGAVAIVADGVITGAILVVRVSARPFDRDELDALEMLAPLVGSAFAVADTHETATELVDVEPLTGLQNRRRLDLDLASISTEDDVAYVMIDIDHFKNFNDNNGHAAGDEALRQVSALLESSVRPKDLVYRYGGEEFCVLLPGANAEEAAVVAERARAAVEAAQIPGMENQPGERVTISVGVSDSAFGTPDDLVERADAALYESKRNGRNQVTLSSAK